jgi:hypothetical protein
MPESVPRNAVDNFIFHKIAAAGVDRQHDWVESWLASRHSGRSQPNPDKESAC